MNSLEQLRSISNNLNRFRKEDRLTDVTLNVSGEKN